MGKSLSGRKKAVKKKKKPKIIIGWKEHISLPDLHIWDLPAKIDTGAKTSSLHVEDIEILSRQRVKFKVIMDEKTPGKTKTHTAKIHRTGLVRTNHRHVENRFFIITTLRLGPVEQKIQLNLVDRSDLRFRIILGRTAIAKHFLIDAQRGRLISK